MNKIIALFSSKIRFHVASNILLGGNGKMYLLLSSDSQPCEQIRLCVQTHKQNTSYKCSPNQASDSV